MLGTLMKYEFKAVGRLLLPLYGAWIIAAALLGISIGDDGAGSGILFIVISALLYGAVTMVAVILTCIILVQRFYKNLLGNEGYLMFTLPVSTGNHLINKLISGAVWGSAGIIVAAISGLLIAGFTTGFQTIFDNIHFFIGDFNEVVQDEPSIILVILEVLVIVFLAFGETAAKVYAAIAVGHQWGNHRVMGAIGAYIGFGIIETVIGNLFGKIVDSGAFDSILYGMEDMTPIATLHLTMVLAAVVIAAVAAIYGFVAWKLLDKRLNLE